MPDAVKLIDEQIKKLEDIKENLSKNMAALNMQLNAFLESVRQQQESD